LGKFAEIERIEVGWPVSGTHQYFTRVGKNQFWEIREDSKEMKRLERKMVPFHLSAAQGGAGKEQHSLRESPKVTP